jgi:subfamily B ATP-binding cassette protein HlyB/CyaB
MVWQMELSHDDLLWTLGALCQLYRVPFDGDLVARQFPPPHTLAALHEAAQALGFRTGARKIDPRQWDGLPLPAVAFLRDAAVAPTEQATAIQPVLLLQADAGRLLTLRPGAQVPEELETSAALSRLDPQLILVAHEPPATADDDPHGRPAAPAFGFRWFLPPLLKNKRVIRDVLLASLAIQLVGLATPLFTQVIIDKPTTARAPCWCWG